MKIEPGIRVRVAQADMFDNSIYNKDGIVLSFGSDPIDNRYCHIRLVEGNSVHRVLKSDLEVINYGT